MRLLFIFILHFVSHILIGQNYDNIRISICPYFGNERLNLDTNYMINEDTISIDELKFYIGNIELFGDNDSLLGSRIDYHLYNIKDSLSHVINIERRSTDIVEKLKFVIGVDSMTHDLGAMGGDLDPTKGMYWTWQTGYINFKLEGKSVQSTSRNNEFQFHIGGYSHPNATMESFEIMGGFDSDIVIMVDIRKFLDQIDIAQTSKIMSPGPRAKRLSDGLVKCFRVE